MEFSSSSAGAKNATEKHLEQERREKQKNLFFKMRYSKVAK
jgi:hypothetical protein